MQVVKQGAAGKPSVGVICPAIFTGGQTEVMTFHGSCLPRRSLPRTEADAWDFLDPSVGASQHHTKCSHTLLTKNRSLSARPPLRGQLSGEHSRVNQKGRYSHYHFQGIPSVSGGKESWESLLWWSVPSRMNRKLLHEAS